MGPLCLATLWIQLSLYVHRYRRPIPIDSFTGTAENKKVKGERALSKCEVGPDVVKLLKQWPRRHREGCKDRERGASFRSPLYLYCYRDCSSLSWRASRSRQPFRRDRKSSRHHCAGRPLDSAEVIADSTLDSSSSLLSPSMRVHRS